LAKILCEIFFGGNTIDWEGFSLMGIPLDIKEEQVNVRSN